MRAQLKPIYPAIVLLPLLLQVATPREERTAIRSQKVLSMSISDHRKATQNEPPPLVCCVCVCVVK